MSANTPVAAAWPSASSDPAPPKALVLVLLLEVALTKTLFAPASAAGLVLFRIKTLSSTLAVVLLRETLTAKDTPSPSFEPVAGLSGFGVAFTVSVELLLDNTDRSLAPTLMTAPSAMVVALVFSTLFNAKLPAKPVLRAPAPDTDSAENCRASSMPTVLLASSMSPPLELTFAPVPIRVSAVISARLIATAMPTPNSVPPVVVFPVVVPLPTALASALDWASTELEAINDTFPDATTDFESATNAFA